MGGKSYSPDFAYVIHFEDGEKKLFFIVETKNIENDQLRNEEKQKIKHAKTFFGNTVKIQFRTQFESTQMIDLIREIYNSGLLLVVSDKFDRNNGAYSYERRDNKHAHNSKCPSAISKYRSAQCSTYSSTKLI